MTLTTASIPVILRTGLTISKQFTNSYLGKTWLGKRKRFQPESTLINPPRVALQPPIPKVQRPLKNSEEEPITIGLLHPQQIKQGGNSVSADNSDVHTKKPAIISSSLTTFTAVLNKKTETNDYTSECAGG